MSLRDTLAILIVAALWLAVFVPVLIPAFHELQALKADDKSGRRREEFKAGLQARARWMVPLYWAAAGLCTGFVADHPLPVGAGVLFVRSLIFLIGGVRWKNLGALLQPVVGFAAGALLGHWIQAGFIH